MTRTYIRLIIFALIFMLASCGSIDDESISTGHSGETEDESEVVSKSDNNEEQPNEITTSESLSELTVHYIDAGQADATLFQFSDQNDTYTLLYDTGDWNKNDVVQYLTDQNVSDIDLVIVSHPHADHIGQLTHIIKKFNVGEVWMSGDESSSNTFTDSIQAIIDSDADYHEPRSGEKYELGSLKIDVLHPASLKANDLNANSISLLISYEDISFLFTGDAGKREELDMISRFPKLQANILQLGHHGSNTSSDPAFINQVKPEAVIYSAGENNSYGHPDAEVLSYIKQLTTKIYGTDIHGSIIVTTDGKQYSIHTEKDGDVQPDHKTDDKHNEKNQIENNQAVSGSCININEASEEELQNIIHIGPKRAGNIVINRPYETVDDLQKVNGIGPARIADIKEEGLACT